MEYVFAALGALAVFLVILVLGPLRNEPTDEELLRQYESDYRDSRYGSEKDVK